MAITTERKKRDSVLYFVVPGFDMSIATLPFQFWSLAEFLWSFHHCVFPAFLLYCDASGAFTVSACGLSVRHFRQDLQNVRRPKPGWQLRLYPASAEICCWQSCGWCWMQELCFLLEPGTRQPTPEALKLKIRNGDSGVRLWELLGLSLCAAMYYWKWGWCWCCNKFELSLKHIRCRYSVI